MQDAEGGRLFVTVTPAQLEAQGHQVAVGKSVEPLSQLWRTALRRHKDQRVTSIGMVPHGKAKSGTGSGLRPILSGSRSVYIACGD